ncbi:DUF416 family protein [Rhodococcus spelaei]|nr:DUF416 family protein [Rhodococcus spelaei]
MNLQTYDELAFGKRLAALDRRSKTAFAASCAERLLPLFERYARSVEAVELGSRLGVIVAAAWEVASGVEADVRAYQDEAGAMVPSDEDSWILETGYGQNAAAAAAYAVGTWLTDDPQEAALAAYQVYELADYAVQQINPSLDLNAAGSETRILASGIVQSALTALDRALAAAESAPSTWQKLRADAEADGQEWAGTLP